MQSVWFFLYICLIIPDFLLGHLLSSFFFSLCFVSLKVKNDSLSQHATTHNGRKVTDVSPCRHSHPTYIYLTSHIHRSLTQVK